MDAGGAAWSPDGQSILFQAYDLQLYRYLVASGTTLQLTSGEAKYRYPSWAPNGSRAAVSSTRDDGQFSLYLLAPDGGQVRRATRPTDSTAVEVRSSWSPDGARFAFETYVGKLVLTSTIFVCDTLCVTARRLAPGIAPAWDPLGIWIAYMEETSSGGSSNLRLVHPDGSGNHAIFSRPLPGNPGFPSGSPARTPDGKWIMFARFFSAGGGLWAIRPDGTGLRQITGPIPPRR